MRRLGVCLSLMAALNVARAADNAPLPGPLTDRPGDPAAGRTLFVGRDGGHCVLCHCVDSLDAPFQGNVGPDLSAAGARLSAAQIRDRIVDPTRANPEAAMPAYYRTADLRQVEAQMQGRTVLTAQQVEDLVAWLVTLGRRP